MGDELARCDREAGLAAKPGARRARCRTAFKRSDLKPNDLARGNVISLAAGKLARQSREQGLGRPALAEGA